MPVRWECASVTEHECPPRGSILQPGNLAICPRIASNARMQGPYLPQISAFPSPPQHNHFLIFCHNAYNRHHYRLTLQVLVTATTDIKSDKNWVCSGATKLAAISSVSQCAVWKGSCGRPQKLNCLNKMAQDDRSWWYHFCGRNISKFETFKIRYFAMASTAKTLKHIIAMVTAKQWKLTNGYPDQSCLRCCGQITTARWFEFLNADDIELLDIRYAVFVHVPNKTLKRNPGLVLGKFGQTHSCLHRIPIMWLSWKFHLIYMHWLAFHG